MSRLTYHMKYMKCVCHSVMSDSLEPHGLQPAKLLCLWNSLGKNTEVSSHSLVPEIVKDREALCAAVHGVAKSQA